MAFSIEHAGHLAIETGENEPIDVAEGKALRRLAAKHIDLMAKNDNFGLRTGTARSQGTKPTWRSTIALNITRFAAAGQPILGLR